MQAQGYYQQASSYYQTAFGLNKGSANYMVDQNSRVASMLSLRCAVQQAVQKVALFSRGAFAPINNPTKPECDFTPNFQQLIASGQMLGATLTSQLSNSLGASSSITTSQTTSAQYTLMKQLLLDSLLSLAAALTSIANSINVVGGKANSADKNPQTLFGSACVCGFNSLFPALCATVNQNLTGPFSQVFISNPASVDLTTYLTATQINALFYSDAFPQFGEYIWSSLAGTVATGCQNTQNPDTLFAISNYISQLNGNIRSLYGYAFLPDLAAQAATSTGVTALETSIDSDISTAEQSRLVNAAGYVG